VPVASEPAVLDALQRYLVRLDARLADTTMDFDAHMLDERYIDSLRATELLAFVERTYGVDVDADRLLTDLSSLRALAAWIVAAGDRRS
jgi:acyl carrier protein